MKRSTIHVVHVSILLFFVVPSPIVLVTALDDQVLGDPLTLNCVVIAVLGISSPVDIIWTVDDDIVRRVNDVSATISNNSAIYNDSLVIPELTALDNGRTYQCTVLINKSPPANFSGSMMLDFPGKLHGMLFACVLFYHDKTIELYCMKMFNSTFTQVVLMLSN